MLSLAEGLLPARRGRGHPRRLTCMQIVDRRLNPKSKSLGNRQRFLRRAKADIRDAVKDALKGRKVSEAEGGEKVTIRSKSLREPSFRLGRNTGQRDSGSRWGNGLVDQSSIPGRTGSRVPSTRRRFFAQALRRSRSSARAK